MYRSFFKKLKYFKTLEKQKIKEFSGANKSNLTICAKSNTLQSNVAYSGDTRCTPNAQINQCHSPDSQVKETHMFVSVNAEKELGKAQSQCLIETGNKLGTEGHFFNLLKYIYGTPAANTLKSGRFNAFPQDKEQRKDVPSQLPTEHCENHSVIQVRKYIKGIQIGKKEKIQLFSFRDDSFYRRC